MKCKGKYHNRYHAWLQAGLPKPPFYGWQEHFPRSFRYRRYKAQKGKPVFHTRTAMPDKTSAPDDNCLPVPDFWIPTWFLSEPGHFLLLNEANHQDAVFSSGIYRCMRKQCRGGWSRRQHRISQDVFLPVHPESCAMAWRWWHVWKVLNVPG